MNRNIGIIIGLISLVFSLGINAQIENPVAWEVEISDQKNVMGMYEITFTATIEKNWHMYSQHLPSPDDGPLPTIFSFDYESEFDIVGKVAEVTEPKSVFDEVFEVNVNYFDNKAVFKQLVSLNDKENGATINGSISFMVCDNSMCLPPEDVLFSVTIKP